MQTTKTGFGELLDGLATASLWKGISCNMGQSVEQYEEYKMFTWLPPLSAPLLIRILNLLKITSLRHLFELRNHEINS